jgi:hypothetical protein
MLHVSFDRDRTLKQLLGLVPERSSRRIPTSCG